MGKFYAVKAGRKCGIFTSWEETKPLVDGFPDAQYKSFKTKEEADKYMSGQDNKIKESEKGLCAYVDGSYNANEKRYSYGVVILIDGEIEETINGVGDNEEAASMRNVAGELKGAMTAMKYAADKGYSEITIYHDYEGIGAWAKKSWKTNLASTKAYVEFYEAISKKIKVNFIKVPAHSGVKYNEMADKLAKEALK